MGRLTQKNANRDIKAQTQKDRQTLSQRDWVTKCKAAKSQKDYLPVSKQTDKQKTNTQCKETQTGSKDPPRNSKSEMQCLSVYTIGKI
jgi:hypothetical protein